MLRLLVGFALLLACASRSFAQFHRINQVLQRGTGVDADVVPNALIKVCAPGATTSSCTPASIYENISLTLPLKPILRTDSSGSYDYYAAFGCLDEIIYIPGATTKVVHNICSAGSSILSSAGPAGTIQIGTVTTGTAGSAASVTNVGTASAAILNISIPQGAAGTNGVNGVKGTTGAAGANGINGASPAFSIGTVSTGAAGSKAAVTLGGTTLAPVLNFSIPQGEPGVSGSGLGGVSTSTPETITAAWTFTDGIYGDPSKNAAIQLSQGGNGDYIPAYIPGSPDITTVEGVACIVNNLQTSSGTPTANSCDQIATLPLIHSYNMQIKATGPSVPGNTAEFSNIGVGNQYQGASFYDVVPASGTIRTISYAVNNLSTSAVSRSACTIALYDVTTGAVLVGSSTPIILNTTNQVYVTLSGLSIPIVALHNLQVQLTTPAGSTSESLLVSTGIYVN